MKIILGIESTTWRLYNMKNKRRIFFSLFPLWIISCFVVNNPRITTTEIIGDSTTEMILVTRNQITNTKTNISRTSTLLPSGINNMTTTISPIIQPLLLKDLPTGRYIAYATEGLGNKYYIEIISESGKEWGRILNGNKAFISKDQKYIAQKLSQGIRIFDLDRGRMFDLPIDDNCYFSSAESAWDNSGEMLAVSCEGKLLVISSKDGTVVGEISHKIDPDPSGGNYHLHPIWSPNGKWLAFFVFSQDPSLGTQGPFIADVLCFLDKNEGCENAIIFLDNAIEQLLSWTPNNQLAVLNPWENIIQIYDVELSKKTTIINLPKIGGALTFTWSND